MRWHMDYGHSWLEVTNSLLKKLGIADKISHYSYQKDDYAYLEEDCDASIFFEAYFRNKEWWKDKDNRKIVESIKTYLYKEDAPIRRYYSYVNI